MSPAELAAEIRKVIDERADELVPGEIVYLQQAAFTLDGLNEETD